MKKLLLAAILCLGISDVWAQLATDVAIYSKATPKANGILLEWTPKNGTTSFIISRKTPDSKTWQNIATLGASDSSYLDESAQAGTVYEYLFNRKISTTNHYGTLAAGMDIPPVHYRGAILVVIDSALKINIEEQVNTYFTHLALDGWTVHQLEVGTAYDHFRVKDSIQAWHEIKPYRRHTVLLFGNIPVPYSGFINPDAHPEHKGAWPADVYYGEFNGLWEDKRDFSMDANRAANKNFPNDGKFDNSVIPGEVMLQIGRVDLHNITHIGWDTDSLYYNYLSKDMAFRAGSWNVPHRYLFADRLKALGGEYPGRSAVNTANALIGIENMDYVPDADFVDSIHKGPYLMSQATGFGSYTGNTQIKSTDFASPTYSVFGAYFGSYHGDWDNTNNLLRTAISGPGYTLTSIWSGRPQWHLHTLGMGYPIGYSARMTQNNFINQSFQLYDPGAFAGQVHVALHGDPTLRLHPVLPPTNTQSQVAADKKSVELTWDASTDASVSGYFVYRSDSVHGVFNLLNQQQVTGTSFTDSDPLKGTNVYVVKAVKLEEALNGNYWNLSQGDWAEAKDVDGSAEIVAIHETATEDLILYPNPSTGAFTIHTAHSGEQLSIRILDMQGRRVAEYQTRSGQMLNTHNLNPGMYLVNGQGQDGNVYRARLIIR